MVGNLFNYRKKIMLKLHPHLFLKFTGHQLHILGNL